MAPWDAIMKATMKVGDLVEAGMMKMIGVIVSSHKEAWDPMYFVLIDGHEFPFRQDQLKVIA